MQIFALTSGGWMRTSSVDQTIIDLLSQEHAHLTSMQIYEEISQRLPAVNPSTVYRSLERLAANGRVSVSDMGTGSAVYEILGGSRHHHLVCQHCGSVSTIGDDEVRVFFTRIQEKNQFQVITNHLILFGFCEKCQEKGESQVDYLVNNVGR
jgi:Fur family ferric uptake transcriptional regulator